MTRTHLRAIVTSALSLLIGLSLLSAPALMSPAYAVEPDPVVRSVLVVSIDGLNPEAILALGPSRAPPQIGQDCHVHVEGEV